MKTYIVILGLLLSVFADAAQTETIPPCQAAYIAGIEHFEGGEFRAASESFIQAIKLAPGPESQPTEYLPYIYLSVARIEMGRTRQARDALIQSQMFGVASKTATGKQLLEQYATEIMSAPLDEPEFVSSPQSSPVYNDALSLSEGEAGLIRAQVLRRCSLSSKLDENKLPWYFHYEFGVELMNAGDAQRAVDSFILGANVREEPSRGKRMYGMWFIDYLPYYQIALAHSRLGEWQSAYNALKASESSGEFSPSDSDYESFTELNQLVMSNLTDNGS